MELDAAAACRALVRVLRARIAELQLPPDRRLERIEATYGGADVIIEGYHGDIMRLLAEVTIDRDTGTAELSLIATKGELSVDTVAWGESGRLIGNSILVAMLLELSICVLRPQGIRALVDRPWNERLRRYYAQMGFAGGTRLDLADEVMLSIAFDFIERAYAKHGLALVVEA